MISRRKFIRNTVAGIGSLSALTFLYSWRVEPHWLEFVRQELPVAGLPVELDGRTLVQLSDLHIGPKVDNSFIIHVFERVRALNPEIVAMTGDWITYRNGAQLRQLEDLTRHFPRGRLATVGILGNHDYGFGWRMTEVAEQVARILADAGISVLRNQSLAVAGLQFLGLDDLWSPRFSPETLMKEHHADPATIVLCHNPDAADRPVWRGFSGWILSGHTHGGQCKPPFLPPPLLPVRNRRYTAGKFALSGGRRLYINRGVGHLIRVRFNVRPEATVFRLRRAEQ